MSCNDVCHTFSFGVNATTYPQFLVKVGFNCHGGYYISYTLPYELSHRMSLDHFRKLPGTYPSPRDHNNPEAWIPIGQTSVEEYEAQALPV